MGELELSGAAAIGPYFVHAGPQLAIDRGDRLDGIGPAIPHK
jgi:hypothetical protein